MKKHMSASIDGLLNLTTKKLGRLLEMDGLKARKELLERKAKGEKLIPSADCDGFDPINGCPGHNG